MQLIYWMRQVFSRWHRLIDKAHFESADQSLIGRQGLIGAHHRTTSKTLQLDSQVVDLARAVAFQLLVVAVSRWFDPATQNPAQQIHAAIPAADFGGSRR